MMLIYVLWIYVPTPTYKYTITDKYKHIYNTYDIYTRYPSYDVVIIKDIIFMYLNYTYYKQNRFF